MIELVIVACLARSPALCEERVLLYDAAEVGLLACVTSAQPQLARWSEEHPGFRIARWSCRMGGAHVEADL